MRFSARTGGTTGPGLFALLLFCCVSLQAFAGGVPQKSKDKAGPETFHGKARVGTGRSAADTLVAIHIDQYTSQRDIETMQRALQEGGHDGFVQALRAAPVAGSLDFGGKKFTIRWARQETTPSGRTITVVTDAPVYFVGGGVPGAKPRAGFDVAVLTLNMHVSGVGDGQMAAAAHVKAGGTSGFDIDDYGVEPIRLVSIFRRIS